MCRLSAIERGCSGYSFAGQNAGGADEQARQADSSHVWQGAPGPGNARCIYGPVQWVSYTPVLPAFAELKDKRTGKTLAFDRCVFITAQTPRRSLDELLANNAAQLKPDFETLAHKCAQEIGSKMF